MRIILIADKERKEELVPAGSDIHATVTWVDDIESLQNSQDADACIDLLFDGTAARLTALRRLQPGIIVVNAVARLAIEPGIEFVRMNGWNSFLKRQIIEASGPKDLQQKTEKVFLSINKMVEWIPDMTGLITPRIISSIINEAYFALQENVSSKEEIDTAMKLGTNYPFGPFEWSRKIGLREIFNLLETLSFEEARYKPATLLAEEANA